MLNAIVHLEGIIALLPGNLTPKFERLFILNVEVYNYNRIYKHKMTFSLFFHTIEISLLVVLLFYINKRNVFHQIIALSFN